MHRRAWARPSPRAVAAGAGARGCSLRSQHTPSSPAHLPHWLHVARCLSSHRCFVALAECAPLGSRCEAGPSTGGSGTHPAWTREQCGTCAVALGTLTCVGSELKQEKEQSTGRKHSSSSSSSSAHHTPDLARNQRSRGVTGRHGGSQTVYCKGFPQETREKEQGPLGPRRLYSSPSSSSS